MTSRDFRAIAGIIAEARKDGADTDSRGYVLTSLAQDFARYLATTNPRFDRERFMAAATGNPQRPGDRPRERDYAR
jgi:hypothetical protein